MRSRIATVLAGVADNRDLRRLAAAFAAFNVAEWATWVAILVFAFRRGGAAGTGLVAVVQLVPAALFAPFAAQLADRFPRKRVLAGGYTAQAAAMGLTAAVLYLHAPIAVVFAAAALTATTITLTRPAQGALLPSLAATPDELTAANVACGWVENGSALAGPLATAGLLSVGGPGLVFLSMGCLVAVAAVAMALPARAGAHAQPAPPARAASAARGGLLAESMAGLGTVAHESGPRVVVLLGSVTSVLIGALDVLTVVLALAVLHTGAGGPGLLTAAIGLGGVLGAASATGLVGRPRMSGAVLGGLLVSGAALAAASGSGGIVIAVVLLAFTGVGRSVADIASRTLLQRVTEHDVLARVFGVLEGLMMAALAVGSAAAGALAANLGARGALVVVGAVTALCALVGGWPLVRVDRSATTDPAAIRLLHAIGMFRLLPAPVLERLAREVWWQLASAGDVLVREGEPGEEFYVLASGRVGVDQRGRRLRELGAGDFFGEIALLADVPRTATVTALEPAKLLLLRREAFLEALTGHPQSLGAARGRASAVLAAESEE